MTRRTICAAMTIAVCSSLPAQAAQLAPAAAGSSDAVRTGVTLAVLAVLPALLVAMSSFTRIVIVLSMVRHAFAMPETPPNSVLVSLAPPDCSNRQRPAPC